MTGMADDRVKVYDSESGNVLSLSPAAAEAALANKERFTKTKPKDWAKLSAPKRRPDRFPQEAAAPEGDK